MPYIRKIRSKPAVEMPVPTTPLTKSKSLSSLATALLSPTPAKSKLAAGSKQHLIDSNYLLIVLWLEDLANQNSIFGTPKSTKVGGSNPLKNVGLNVLATAVNKNSKGRLLLTHLGMGGGLRTYRENLRLALQMEAGTGFGITDKDCSNDPSIKPSVTITTMNKSRSDNSDLDTDDNENSESDLANNNNKSAPTTAMETGISSNTSTPVNFPVDMDDLKNLETLDLSYTQQDADQDCADTDQDGTELETVSMPSKRKGKGSKTKDPRRTPPSLNTKQDHCPNFATVFESVAKSKVDTLVTIEANCLAIEKEKWNTERAAMTVPSSQTVEMDHLALERENLHDKVLEREWQTESEKRAQQSSLVLNLVSQGKSSDEIKAMLSLLD